MTREGPAQARLTDVGRPACSCAIWAHAAHRSGGILTEKHVLAAGASRTCGRRDMLGTPNGERNGASESGAMSR